jgi:Tol biopolymer transport system component
MRNDHDVGGEALIPWVLAAAILLVGASSCSNDTLVAAPTSNPTTAASGKPSPETSPMPSSTSGAKALGIFSEVGGWIAYGNDEGIWAVNPTPGDSRSDRIELSDRPGEPVAWSSDGSKLLIDPSYLGPDDLVVLNSDGTETVLVHGGMHESFSGGSFTPDGSKVVYSAGTWPPGEEWRSGIYVVDADGGSPRLLLASGPRTYPDGTFHTAVGGPVLSPDGTQIAYFDGMGDWGNSLRVMNADGSGVRGLIDQEFGHVDNLAWSPDGSRLAFNETYGGIWIVGVDGSGLTTIDGRGVHWSPTGDRLTFESGSPSSAGLWVPEGIWVMNADGSGLRKVAPAGRDPVWSPDRSRIAYLYQGSLYVVNLGGTHLRTLGTLEPPRRGSIPMAWMPLPPSASGGE